MSQAVQCPDFQVGTLTAVWWIQLHCYIFKLVYNFTAKADLPISYKWKGPDNDEYDTEKILHKVEQVHLTLGWYLQSLLQCFPSPLKLPILSFPQFSILNPKIFSWLSFFYEHLVLWPLFTNPAETLLILMQLHLFKDYWILWIF